jgi:hypothetical protein
MEAPTVSIRMPADLRAQAEAYGRERRWTLGETTRVALEQLIAREDNQPTGTEASA